MREVPIERSRYTMRRLVFARVGRQPVTVRAELAWPFSQRKCSGLAPAVEAKAAACALRQVWRSSGRSDHPGNPKFGVKRVFIEVPAEAPDPRKGPGR